MAANDGKLYQRKPGQKIIEDTLFTEAQVAIIKGMILRKDSLHDIAPRFGVNPGRIMEVKAGRRKPEVMPAPPELLPPSGPITPAIDYPLPDPSEPPELQYNKLYNLMSLLTDQQSVVIIYTPELSRLILDRLNRHNRKRRSNKIRRYGDLMADGDWPLTGDQIRFSRKDEEEDGYLLDGQNRLYGSVNSNSTFASHTIFGLDKKVFNRIDSGAGRTNSDMFHVAGVPYPPIASSATRWLLLNQTPRADGAPDRSRTIDGVELWEYYTQNVNANHLTTMCREVMAIRGNKEMAETFHLPLGMLTALLYQFSQYDHNAYQRFANDLKQRKGIAKRLITKMQRIHTQMSGRIHELHSSALIIITWNAYYNKTNLTMSEISWNEDKEYPSIAGYPYARSSVVGDHHTAEAPAPISARTGKDAC